MARINIEECWWSDVRRAKLIRFFKGDSRIADGLMVHAWRLSQEFHAEGFLIPLDQFLCLEDASYLFNCCLAEIRHKDVLTGSIIVQQNSSTPPTDLQQNPTNTNNWLRSVGDGCPTGQKVMVYVKGSENYLDWLKRQKQTKSDAGQLSAQRPRDTRGRLLPNVQQNSSTPPTESSTPPTESNRVQRSYSSSGSSSSSSSFSKNKEEEERNTKNKNVGIRLDYPPAFNELWEVYGRRGDKKEALQEYERLKLSTQELDALRKAAQNYATQTEWSFRKHFCRFLKSDWREYIEIKPIVLGNGFHQKTKDQILADNNDAVIARALGRMNNGQLAKGERGQ